MKESKTPRELAADELVTAVNALANAARLLRSSRLFEYLDIAWRHAGFALELARVVESDVTGTRLTAPRTFPEVAPDSERAAAAGGYDAKAVRKEIGRLRGEEWSFARIAERLNRLGFTTRRGQAWTTYTAMREVIEPVTTPAPQLNLPELSETERECLRFARDLRRQNLSLQVIADRLTEAGFPTKKGGRWQKQTVADLLGEVAPTKKPQPA